VGKRQVLTTFLLSPLVGYTAPFRFSTKPSGLICGSRLSGRGRSVSIAVLRICSAISQQASVRVSISLKD